MTESVSFGAANSNLIWQIYRRGKILTGKIPDAHGTIANGCGKLRYRVFCCLMTPTTGINLVDDGEHIQLCQ